MKIINIQLFAVGIHKYGANNQANLVALFARHSNHNGTNLLRMSKEKYLWPLLDFFLGNLRSVPVFRRLSWTLRTSNKRFTQVLRS